MPHDRTGTSGAYNPEAHGAQCGRCPLRGRTPVPPEEHHGALFDFVGPYPGEDETRAGRPWVGPAGMEALRAFTSAGLRRADANWRNLLCCAPENGNLEAVKADARANGLLDPIAACAPRLRNEMAHTHRVVTAGAEAARQLIPGVTGGILDYRGNVVDIPAGLSEGFAGPRQIVPTVNPAFTLRSPRFRSAFYGDIARALRFFGGRLDWTAPRMWHRPSIGQLRTFFAQARKWWSWDLETDAKYPVLASIRCIGIVTDQGDGVLVPLLSIDGRTRFYSEIEEAQIVAEVCAFLTSKAHLKIGWNQGYYDHLCVEARWRVAPANQQDMMLYHHVAEPEVPHSLDYVASCRTDAPRWKKNAQGKKISTGAQSDDELAVYCGFDCHGVSRMAAGLAADIKKRGRAAEVVALEHKIQGVCRELHKIGMPVDTRPIGLWEISFKDGRAELVESEAPPPLPPNAKTVGPANRVAWDQKLTADAAKWLDAARAALAEDRRASAEAGRVAALELGLGGPAAALGFAEDDGASGADGAESDGAVFDAGPLLGRAAGTGYNPGSPEQVRRIFFGVWGMTPPSGLPKKVAYTSSGAESTGDAVLIAMLADRSLEPARRRLIEATRGYRLAVKLVGTYVRPLAVPMSLDGGRIWPDGRVHASWNVHVTSPGRLSCNDPNLQNVRSKLRNMFRAYGARMMFGADADQIHLRIVAARWKVERLLEIFRRGGDPHAVNAEAMFGAAFRNAPGHPAGPGGKWTGLAKMMRDISKIIAFASLYGADAKTVHRVLVSTEDAEGNLVNHERTLTEVRALHAAWLASMPEIEQGWAWEIANWRKNGYVEEPVTGRRCELRDVVGDETDFHSIVNWPTLASEAAIMHGVTLDCVAALPFGFDGPCSGLINQTHDSLTFEASSLAAATRGAAILREVFPRTLPCYSDVRFTGTPCIGPTWAEA